MRAAAPELRRREWSGSALWVRGRDDCGWGDAASTSDTAPSSNEVPGAKLPSREDRRRRPLEPEMFVAERLRMSWGRCWPRVERAVSSDRGRKLLMPPPDSRFVDDVDDMVDCVAWSSKGGLPSHLYMVREGEEARLIANIWNLNHQTVVLWFVPCSARVSQKSKSTLEVWGALSSLRHPHLRLFGFIRSTAKCI